ncbi:transcriptional regulator [Leptolyngbya sp. NIES-3755]|nr:transcriptional regulator [Leptolyngbya sp. NIES-3755]
MGDDASKTEKICQPDSFEVCHSWKSALCQGYMRRVELRDLWLEIEERRVTKDVVFKFESASWGPVSGFFVTGSSKNRYLDLTCENAETPGRNYLESIQSGIEFNYLFAAEPVLRVRLGFQRDALMRFQDFSTLPPELVPLVCGKAASSFYRQGNTTPEMQVILHQILHCPYQGAIKQMYLEGKVLELAALQFVQLLETNRSSHQESAFKADEVERLHHAKDILMQQFENPPSILALAHQVGLNDFKLKQGFRQVFGTTVFGYLREYRLEQARLLLADGQLNVQQVAQAIGYAHAGYFANAFKRKFGINPKAYRSHSAQATIDASKNPPSATNNPLSS